MVNNLDWTAPLAPSTSCATSASTSASTGCSRKDAVAARLNGDAGISYTEFSYQIAAGPDYLAAVPAVRLHAADRRAATSGATSPPAPT